MTETEAHFVLNTELLMYSITLVLAALAATPAENPPAKFVLKTEDAETITATMTYNVSAEKVDATRWVVFTALAPELPCQTKVKTVVSPPGVVATELSPFARKMLIIDVKASTTALKTKLPIKATYTATLRSRKLVPLAEGETAPEVPPLPDKERKMYLTEFGDCDFSRVAFDKWMKAEGLVKKADETDLDYARRAFVTIGLKYKYDSKLGMKHNAASVCTESYSDCAGLSMLFVALMRKHDIPARTLYGRWAKSAEPTKTLNGQPYLQWHVKAEFFATGIGWVPIDLSGAVQFDKSEAGLEFFGNDPGDFLTFHIDPDFTVNTKIQGKQELQGLQRPALWVAGKGSFEGNKVVENWEVK